MARPRRLQARAPARTAALLAVLALIAAPLAGQTVAGRWRITLRGGVTGPLRGELRLTETAERLGGTLWLEDAEEPVPVDGARAGAQFRFTAAIPRPVEFTGALEKGSLQGLASDSAGGRPWTASRMRPEAEYYPVLPRFTLRQVIAGRRGSELRVPGAWVAAARARPADDDSAYSALARAAGISRLGGDTLEGAGPLRAMGMARRQETRAAIVRTLEDIRRQIGDPAVASRFDRLFRPRGAWVIDLHDAALLLARTGSPGLDPAATVPALRAIGWLPADAPPDDGIPLALYRLYALRAADSSGATALADAMRRASPASAHAVTTLLGAYDAAASWHTAALRFLLTEPWIAGSGGARSVAGMVRAAWEGADTATAPELGARVFGFPQAVPRYGVPDALMPRLLRAENLSARQWLARHGGNELLAVLRLLPVDFGETSMLEAPAETFRIVSVRQQSEQSLNGLLEPRDAILVDPGYVPILALGAVVHEWQHLLEERRRRVRLAEGTGEIIVFSPMDPFVAEGIAERRTELLLAPLVRQFPLLGVSEVEKRVRLAARSADEHHVLGYAMVRAVEDAVADSDRRASILADAAGDPAAALRASELERAWRRHAGAPELRVDAPSRRVVVPETTFTVEDRFPDVIATRLLAPVRPIPD